MTINQINSPQERIQLSITKIKEIISKDLDRVTDKRNTYLDARSACEKRINDYNHQISCLELDLAKQLSANYKRHYQHKIAAIRNLLRAEGGIKLAINQKMQVLNNKCEAFQNLQTKSDELSANLMTALDYKELLTAYEQELKKTPLSPSGGRAAFEFLVDIITFVAKALIWIAAVAIAIAPAIFIGPAAIITSGLLLLPLAALAASLHCATSFVSGSVKEHAANKNLFFNSSKAGRELKHIEKDRASMEVPRENEQEQLVGGSYAH